jgi:hypothetical protein
MKNKNLWVDDLRKPPDGWVWAKNYSEAVPMIMTGEYRVVSLDHDLGDVDDYTGYDILCAIERQIVKGGFWIALPEFRVHTANPVGRDNMIRVIEAIKKLAKALDVKSA